MYFTESKQKIKAAAENMATERAARLNAYLSTLDGLLAIHEYQAELQQELEKNGELHPGDPLPPFTPNGLKSFVGDFQHKGYIGRAGVPHPDAYVLRQKEILSSAQLGRELVELANERLRFDAINGVDNKLAEARKIFRNLDTSNLHGRIMDNITDGCTSVDALEVQFLFCEIIKETWTCNVNGRDIIIYRIQALSSFEQIQRHLKHWLVMAKATFDVKNLMVSGGKVPATAYRDCLRRANDEYIVGGLNDVAGDNRYTKVDCPASELNISSIICAASNQVREVQDHVLKDNKQISLRVLAIANAVAESFPDSGLFENIEVAKYERDLVIHTVFSDRSDINHLVETLANYERCRLRLNDFANGHWAEGAGVDDTMEEFVESMFAHNHAQYISAISDLREHSDKNKIYPQYSTYNPYSLLEHFMTNLRDQVVEMDKFFKKLKETGVEPTQAILNEMDIARSFAFNHTEVKRYFSESPIAEMSIPCMSAVPGAPCIIAYGDVVVHKRPSLVYYVQGDSGASAAPTMEFSPTLCAMSSDDFLTANVFI